MQIKEIERELELPEEEAKWIFRRALGKMRKLAAIAGCFKSILLERYWSALKRNLKKKLKKIAPVLFYCSPCLWQLDKVADSS